LHHAVAKLAALGGVQRPAIASILSHTHTRSQSFCAQTKTRQNGTRNVHLKFLFLNASLYLLNFIIYEFFYMSIMLWDIHKFFIF
jgi:uncharacterized membrane protein